MLKPFFLKLSKGLLFKCMKWKFPLRSILRTHFYLYRVAQEDYSVMCYDFLFCHKQQRNYGTLKANMGEERGKKRKCLYLFILTWLLQKSDTKYLLVSEKGRKRPYRPSIHNTEIKPSIVCQDNRTSL
jgi:hypothetical protein